MKILFDHQIFSLQKYGGISNYYYNLVKNFKSMNDQFKIFAPFYINKYISDLPKKNIYGLKINVDFFNFFYKINNALYNFNLKNYDPDIVHLTYYNDNNNKDPKKKYVLTVYDMIHEQFVEEFSNNMTSTNKFYACQKADHIICISETTKKKLINFFKIPDKKVSVVYLGSDHLDTISIEKGFKKNKNYILYVGSRNGYKNFSKFLYAYSINERIMSNFNIVIFGGEKCDKNLILQLNRFGINIDKVKFISGSQNTLKTLYINASLFVYPSLDEGFGIPPLEAMSCGCPVACSKIEVLQEILSDSCLYFDPNNADEISHVMEKILYSETKKKLIELGLTRKKLFLWSKCSENTYNLYKRLL